VLPPEVNVEVHGIGVMGGFDQKVDGTGTKGAPTAKAFKQSAKTAKKK
jgi:hypothetical protein